MYAEEKTNPAAASHTAQIDWDRRNNNKRNIDCDFLRLNGYLFLHPTDKKESLEKEPEATQQAGFKLEDSGNFPLSCAGASEGSSTR